MTDPAPTISPQAPGASPANTAGATPGPLVTTGVLLMAATTTMANATIAPSLPLLRAHYAGVPGIDTFAGLIGWLSDRFDRQRLVLGVGVAGMMVLATTWAGDLWAGPARARFLGLQGAVMLAGGIVVALVGGGLASLHWRGAFATYLLVLPVTALALAALAPYARRKATAVRVAAATGDLAPPWAAFAFLGSLGFLFMAIVYVMPTRLPFLLGERGVSNPMVVAAVMSTTTLFSLPGALFCGRIRQRLSVMAIFALSWSLMGAGMLLLSLAPTMPLMVAGVALIGLGIGPSLPNYMAHWLSVVQPGLRGRAAGMLTTAFFAGQLASPLITAPLVGAFGLSDTFEMLAFGQLVPAGILGLATLREGLVAVIA